jgi:hypothetical protein
MSVESLTGEMPSSNFGGAFDFAAHRARFSLEGGSLGLGDTRIDAIMDFSNTFVQYLKVPGLAEQSGKHWMKIDVTSAMKDVCPDIDFASLLGSQSGDPTAGLYNLGAAAIAKPRGTETIRGTKTTKFHVEYDVSKLAEAAPAELRATYRQLAGFYAEPKQELDVWLDGDKRVRRLEQTIDPASLNLPKCLTSAAQGTNPFKGAVTVVQELYDFGTKVDITLPKANDVVDLADLVSDIGADR